MTIYYNYLGQPMATSAGGGTFVQGDSSGNETINAPPGPSEVSDGGGNYDTLVASNGDNIFDVSFVTDVVQAASGLTGVKTIVAYSSGYTLPDNVQNLTFYGAGNWGAGNSLDNLIIMGGNDHNTMDGGAGNDVLVGGDGENDIQFEVGGGNDVVYNFHPAQDTVRITGASFTSFAQIQSAMTQVTGQASGTTDVVLRVDANDSITFRDTTIAAFQPSDFLLPLDRSQLGTLTFDDEFTSLNLFNPATGQGNWQTNFGGDLTSANAYFIQGNDEKQLYTAPGFVGQQGRDLSAYNPFSINQGGGLDITAGQFSYLDSQYTYGQAYYSGMLNTRGVFMQKYGYFEMKAELPATMGTWPAFWLSQDPYKPGVEGDILEHLAMYPNSVFSRSNDGGVVSGHTTYMPTLSGFHTYGMLWGPTNTTFYVDDVAVMQVATPASWDQPMYMLLDMALGGWGGPIDANGLPTHMDVDYVHIYGLASSPVQVSEGYATYTAQTGVNAVALLGSGQTVTANNAGDALVSDDGGNTLIGGTGADSITLGGGGDTATGGGGSDDFVINAVPATASQITDFGASDQLDLSGLLSSLNYSGSNAVADGIVKFTDDGHGDAQVWAWTNNAWSLVTTLDGLVASELTLNGGVVTDSGSAASSGPVNVTGTLTINAGQTVNFAGSSDAYDLRGSATLNVLGTVSVQDSGANDVLTGVHAVGTGSNPVFWIKSGGTVDVSSQGAGASAYGFYSGESAHLQNDGTFSVSSDTAPVAAALNAGGVFLNTGSLTVTGHNGAGTGLLAHGAIQAGNSGSVQVSGAAQVQAFDLGASGSFTNSGTITATSSAGTSFGVLAGDTAGGAITIVNTGTINAQYAVDDIPGSGPIALSNSGALNGLVVLGTASGNDVRNTGSITGAVSFNGTSGTQTYDGRGGTLSGGVSFSTASGATGIDYAYLGNDGETAHGGSAQLFAFGGTGADTIIGGSGTNAIDGGGGNDTLNGGSGPGNIVAYYSSAVGVTVSLALQGQAQNTGEGTDTLSNFSGIFGSKFDDHLTGDANNNFIDGGGGNDVIDGGGGVNAIAFGLATSGVNVSLGLQGQGQNTGVGIDTLSHFQVLYGSSHNDTLEGGGPSSALFGELGADTFVYKPGDGAVAVADFTDSQDDRIDLTALTSLHSLADVMAMATQSGANTVIQFDGGGSLTLDNVQESSLTAADFTLSPAPPPANPPPSDPPPSDPPPADPPPADPPPADSPPANPPPTDPPPADPPPESPPPATHPPILADYDGDGASDIAFRDPTTGDWGFFSAGSSGEVWHEVGTTSTDYATMGFGDFNGDGVADVAFRQNGTGAWGYMTAAPSGGETWHAVGATSMDYAPIGVGDFAGDGVDAVAFRQASTGNWGFMTANPGGGETWTGAGASSMAYTAVGVGDFDQDGQADIAFRNNSTGDLGFMSFNPGGGETWHAVGPTSTAYAAIGVGDFNGDGVMDIAFRQTSTGDWGYMSVLPAGGETWHAVGSTSTAYAAIQAGDFDHDGRTDIAFRDAAGDLGYMSVNPAGGEIWHVLGASSTDYFTV